MISGHGGWDFVLAAAAPEPRPEDADRLLYVEVVRNCVISDVHVVGRDKVLQGVVVRVADGHLPSVYVLNAHLSGVDGNLPRVDLVSAVVVEYIRDICSCSLGAKFEFILTYAKERGNTKAFSVELTTKGKKYPINMLLPK